MDNQENIIKKLLNNALKFNQKALAVNNQKDKMAFFRQSLNCYQEILKIDKNNIKAIQGLSRIYLHQKNFSIAIKFSLLGLQLANSKNKYIFLNSLGNIYRYLGDWNKEKKSNYKKSINYYLKAIKSNPYPQIATLYWSNLSRTYAGLQNWPEAIKSNEKALKLLKKETIPHGNLKKILELENKLYKEYKKEPCFKAGFLHFYLHLDLK